MLTGLIDALRKRRNLVRFRTCDISQEISCIETAMLDGAFPEVGAVGKLEKSMPKVGFRVQI